MSELGSYWGDIVQEDSSILHSIGFLILVQPDDRFHRGATSFLNIGDKTNYTNLRLQIDPAAIVSIYTNKYVEGIDSLSKSKPIL
jgi:hypothetical protein